MKLGFWNKVPSNTRMWQNPYKVLGLFFLFFFLVRIGLEAYSGLNPDVAWALVLEQKWLAGETPYVDFFEANPPGVLFIYWPFGMLAHLSGLSQENSLVIGVSLLVLGTNVLMLSLLQPPSHSRHTSIALIPNPVAFLCLVMLLEQLGSGGMYGQREHIAIILLLPFLLLLTLRLGALACPPILAVLIGLLCGIALCIKPNFVLFFLAPATLMLWRLGFIKTFCLPELYAAALMLVLYFITVFTSFPLFHSKFLYFLVNAYITFREPLLDLALQAPPLFFGLFAIPILAKFYEQRSVLWHSLNHAQEHQTQQQQEPTQVCLLLTFVLFLAAFGSTIDFFIQGKGYIYQGLPCLFFIALSFASLGPIWALTFADVKTLKISINVISLIVFIAPFFLTRISRLALQKAILLADTKSHAPLTIAQLCSRDYIVPRLALETHAKFLGSSNANYLTHFSKTRLLTTNNEAMAQKLNDYITLDHAYTRNDIVVKKPKLILVHTQSDTPPDPTLPTESQPPKCVQEFWPDDTEIIKALSDYTYLEHVEGYSLYLRKDEAP